MAKLTHARRLQTARLVRGFLPFTLLLLLIEFFDELHYGVQSAALPALRADLGMSYAQAGLLLGLPLLAGVFIEPLLMLLGDTRLRKTLVVGGGFAVAAAALALSAAGSFPAALLALMLAFPASGAFVTLSQATLMDLNPGREPQMMARWTVFGAAGNLFGPALLAGLYAVGANWRSAYWIIAALGLALALLALPRRFRAAAPQSQAEHAPGTTAPGEAAAPPPARLLPALGGALRSPGLMRWFTLLEFADLMLDVHLSYAALYFADVVGLSPGGLGVVMTAMMAADLLATLALIPILERVPGLRLVRATAWLAGGLYAAWLLAPWLWAKIALAVLLRASTLGWYEVLQGEAYAALPGRSGTVMAVNSLMGVAGAALAWLVGQAAEALGLPAAMWLLLAGPLALIFLLPRARSVVKLK